MRLIKMFSLAAIAAVAAMAFLGASSASAGNTLLCSNNTVSLTPTLEECGVVTSIHFVTVGHAVLLGTINVECNGLLSARTATAKLAGSVVFDKGPAGGEAEEVELAYTKCLGGCAASVVKQGTVTVLKTAAGLADITASGFVVNVTCFGLDCDYDAANLVGHGINTEIEEGGKKVLKSHTVYDKDTVNVQQKLGGFITCPKTGALDALFQSLSNIYIRA